MEMAGIIPQRTVDFATKLRVLRLVLDGWTAAKHPNGCQLCLNYDR